MKSILPFVETSPFHALGTVLFMVVFIALVARLFRAGGKEFYEAAGRLPLDNNGTEHHG